MIHLVTWARDSGDATVAASITEMTQGTGLSRRSVNKAVKGLAAKSLLAIHSQYGARGEYRSNIYYLLLKGLRGKNTQGSEESSQGIAEKFALALKSDSSSIKLRDHYLSGNHMDITTKVQRAIREELSGKPWLKIPPPTGDFYVDKLIWQFALRNAYRRIATLITGPTGVGKTELVSHIAQALDNRLYPINMGATTDTRSALVGTTHFTDFQTSFQESHLVRALQDPQGFILLDELTRANLDAFNLIIPILDQQAYVSLDEAVPPRLVERHPDVIVFATANTGQEYSGTRDLDRALKDRFIIIELDYPPKKAEVALLVKRTNIVRRDAEHLVAFAHDCRDMWRREELATPVSTRMLIEAAAAVTDGFSLIQALEYTVLNFYDSTEGAYSDRTRVRQLLQKF